MLLSTIGGCSCNDRSGRCVMAAISGFPAPERWSSCSVSQIQNSLTRTSNNLGRCLENEPTTTVADPVCGNGIREEDEICDCGSPEVRFTSFMFMPIPRWRSCFTVVVCLTVGM